MAYLYQVFWSEMSFLTFVLFRLLANVYSAVLITISVRSSRRCCGLKPPRIKPYILQCNTIHLHYLRNEESFTIPYRHWRYERSASTSDWTTFCTCFALGRCTHRCKARTAVCNQSYGERIHVGLLFLVSSINICSKLIRGMKTLI